MHESLKGFESFVPISSLDAALHQQMEGKGEYNNFYYVYRRSDVWKSRSMSLRKESVWNL